MSLNGRSSHMNFAFSIPIVTWNVTLPSLLSLRRWLHHEEGEEEVHLQWKKSTQNCISIYPHSKAKGVVNYSILFSKMYPKQQSLNRCRKKRMYSVEIPSHV